MIYKKKTNSSAKIQSEKIKLYPDRIGTNLAAAIGPVIYDIIATITTTN